MKAAVQRKLKHILFIESIKFVYRLSIKFVVYDLDTYFTLRIYIFLYILTLDMVLDLLDFHLFQCQMVMDLEKVIIFGADMSVIKKDS